MLSGPPAALVFCERAGRPSTLVAGFALAAALLLAGAASAQEAPPFSGVAEARRSYERGAEAFRAGRFREAVASFNDAYALGQHPTVLFSLARAHEGLLRLPTAIFYYERYLERAPADAAHRAEVADTLRGLRALLTELAVESDVDARVFVDGEEEGSAPGVLTLAAGRHEVELRADGYTPERQSVTLSPRTRRALTFRLSLTPIAAPPTRLHPAWFWTSVGLTAAAGAAGATLGALTLRAADDYTADPARTVAAREEGRGLALAVDVALGATALLGVTAVVLGVYTQWSSAPPPRLSLAAAPGAVGLAGSF